MDSLKFEIFIERSGEKTDTIAIVVEIFFRLLIKFREPFPEVLGCFRLFTRKTFVRTIVTIKSADQFSTTAIITNGSIYDMKLYLVKGCIGIPDFHFQHFGLKKN